MIPNELQQHAPQIVETWYQKLLPTHQSPHDAETVRHQLHEIFSEMLRLVFEFPANRSAMQVIGARLVGLNYTQPESLRITLELLPKVIVYNVPQPRRQEIVSQLTICFGEIAAGFLREIRQTLSKEQEQSQSNLIAQFENIFEELRALYNASSSLFVSYNLAETAQTITQAMTYEFAHANCGILLLDVQNGLLHRIAHTADKIVDVPQTLVFHGDGLIAKAVRANYPIYVPDVSLDADYLGNNPDTRSEFVVPLRSGDQVIGALDLQSPHLDGFSTRDQRVITFFADRAAAALTNAQLRDTLQQQALDLELRVAQRTAELVRTKEQVESILNSSSDAIFLAYAEGVLRQSNPAFNTLFGFDNGQTFGLELSSLVMPESQGVFEEAFASVVTTLQNSRVEVLMRRKDDTTFNADVAISAIVEPGDEQARVVICSIRDISEQKWLEENLKQSLVKERELNQLRSHFSSMVSHEFRTPLAMIMNASELLRNYGHRMQSDEQTRYLDRIRTQVQYLTGLLDDILMLSKARSVSLSYQPVQIELVSFCQSLIQDMPSEHTGRVNFTTTIPALIVNADPKLLKLCITNLLSNALKYSPKDRPVDLRLSMQENSAVIQIEDRGIGIPETDQTRLFQDFVRATNVGDTPGTGLGLVIVKHVIEMHGGSISFTSTVNVGTTFTLTLPV